MLINIYIPRAGSAPESFLLPASAAVGEPRQSGGVDLWFEGNKHGAENLVRFADRLACAAGRMVADYPTIARAIVRADDLQLVGRYDAARFVVAEIMDQGALEAWASEPLHAIAGVRLAPGPCDWKAAAAAINDGGKLLTPGRPDGTVHSYRTRAGQVVRFDQGTGEAFVHDHDDPDLRRLKGKFRRRWPSWCSAKGSWYSAPND